jgi:hypothetical protein
MSNHGATATSLPSATSGGAPPGDNSAAGLGTPPPTPDPNGATLTALLQAMKDMAAQLATLKTSSTSSATQSAGSPGGNQSGLTADQQALLAQNADFYKKKGLTTDQINAMIDASTGPNAPRGVIAQNNGIDYLQNGAVLPTYPGTGGAVGAPKWSGPQVPRPRIVRPKKKWTLGSVQDLLAAVTDSPAAASLTTSHTDASSPAAASITTNPTDPGSIFGPIPTPANTAYAQSSFAGNQAYYDAYGAAPPYNPGGTGRYTGGH